VFRHHSQGHHIKGTVAPELVDRAPDPLMDEWVLFEGLVGIHTDQDRAAIREDLCHPGAAGEDIAAAAHVEPGAIQGDQRGHRGLVIFVGGEIAEPQAHASRPAEAAGIAVVLDADQFAKLGRRRFDHCVIHGHSDLAPAV
jgi:hypothetical protein